MREADGFRRLFGSAESIKARRGRAIARSSLKRICSASEPVNSQWWAPEFPLVRSQHSTFVIGRYATHPTAAHPLLHRKESDCFHMRDVQSDTHATHLCHLYFYHSSPGLFSLSHLRCHDLYELYPVDWRLCHIAPESSLGSHPNSTPLAMEEKDHTSGGVQPSVRPKTNAIQKMHTSECARPFRPGSRTSLWSACTFFSRIKVVV